MRYEEADLRLYYFCCTKCEASGTVFAKNLEEVRLEAIAKHAEFVKTYESNCTSTVFRVHCPLGSCVEVRSK